jgi:AcrR family transcriptional regulator
LDLIIFLEVVMSPRPDVSEERRNQILEAAIAVFARLGFQRARMDDIADEAGLSKGALYLYYKSKDAIIAALLKYLFTQEFRRLQRLVEADQEAPVTERLLTLTHQFSLMMDWMASLMPIAFEFYAIAGRDKEVRQFLREYFKEYRGELAHLIRRGIERGELREVDAEASAITLVAIYEGLCLLYFVDQESFQWAKQAEMSIHFLLEGLQSQGDHKGAPLQ